MLDVSIHYWHLNAGHILCAQYQGMPAGVGTAFTGPHGTLSFVSAATEMRFMAASAEDMHAHTPCGNIPFVGGAKELPDHSAFQSFQA